jgi:transposase InsO family protein
MIYPLVRELAADGIAIRLTCRVLGFSSQGYYRWLKRPVSARDYENAYLTNALVDAHRSDPAFGYRFLEDELVQQGHLVSERRIWRLCSEALLWASFARKSRSSKRSGPAVHDDLVLRNFSAKRANQLWFIDITEHPTKNGKLYLCSLEDAFSSKIVGYSIGDRMTSGLAVSALRNAITRRRPKGTICHSDRGSQFRSGAFTRTLKNNGLRGSMGRVGAAGDNARMESFHSLLQNNVLDSKKWESQEELRIAIVHWIEGTYHRRRRKRSLGKMTPIEYEVAAEVVDKELLVA